MKFHRHSVNGQFVRSTGYAFLMGVLGGFAVLLLSHFLVSMRPAAIGTVNVTGMVDQFIHQAIALKLSPPQLQQRTQAFGQQLERTINEIAQEKHLILLPQEAVLAGAPDVTALVQKRLQQNLQVGH